MQKRHRNGERKAPKKKYHGKTAKHPFSSVNERYTAIRIKSSVKATIHALFVVTDERSNTDSVSWRKEADDIRIHSMNNVKPITPAEVCAGLAESSIRSWHLTTEYHERALLHLCITKLGS